ncbi:hypothetical protein ppKF707_1885 [Metapseudomonas furukawaii]|uniref:Uncharacterized protein n=1 Tax=Metapseudomonas furukawaii TaxID=1149133 RepID=A0AAD1C3P3_METFU|nr:hypothetical protein ppKF707_1885 [Pseudomonas furukawaii]BAU76879.1 hypothetical protein KF707C_51910 [Pseudomonas furukawaii]
MCHLSIEARIPIVGQLSPKNNFFRAQGFTTQKSARIVRAHSVAETL